MASAPDRNSLYVQRPSTLDDLLDSLAESNDTTWTPLVRDVRAELIGDEALDE